MSIFTKLFESPEDLTRVEHKAEDSSFSGIKDLAKEDLGVLKQLAFLNKLYHGDDPRFTSKEAKIAMSAVLSKLVYADDKTAYFLGSMQWEPNVAVWMRFFDMVGEKPLGQYLGINSSGDLPSFDSNKGEYVGSSAPDDTGTDDMPVADVFDGNQGLDEPNFDNDPVNLADYGL
jgi:hypothetical protein